MNTPFRHVQDILRFPISERRMRVRLRAQLERGTPIVVYSATKTASTAVAAALDRTSGIETVKVHHLQPEHFWPGPLASPVARDGMLRHRAIEQRAARSILLAPDRPLRIVSVMRDPVAFNLSNYTYFGRAYWMRSFWRRAPAMPTATILAHFLKTFPHASSSLWWNQEFAATTGIDICASGFDTARGWQRYEHGRFDCLALRADIDDREKRAALSAWLGCEIAPVERENTNDTQSAPGVYERLKHAIRGETAYIERMLALQSVHAFLDAAQRDR
ncbi:MAG: putative capsular polysaccharide synthesis family protein, partial [bacterium]